MLEALVAKLLSKLLGKYCSNFDKNSLNMSAIFPCHFSFSFCSGFSGTFELKNLRIRPDAFHEFHEGLRVIDGFLCFFHDFEFLLGL